VLPFEDHTVVTCWIREPGGRLRRLGDHRSISLDIGRERLLADDSEVTLIRLAGAILRVSV
jgi:hypothetical protein